MKVLVVILLVVSIALAGITMDMDIQHDHEQQYFSVLKEKKRDQKLQVHIVPHTHDDVGWLKTPDQYYTGDRDDIQRAGVQYVLNGIYDQLMKDPKKKFTYVEMAFFQKWWFEQTDEVQANVQMLVDEGRLQFVNAGWSMSDEANVHYEDFINNMKAGHDFLKKELNYRPTIGWHIDPFGHHSASAALFAEMGFNAWFFARMDHYDKDRRLEEKEMEWLWRPFNESLGSRAEIFTHMMYQHYSSPAGFSFNEFSTDSPIIDDERMENNNVEERTAALYDYLTHMADHYRTDHLLVPFGDDFNYLNAQKIFLNVDKLIKNFNERYDDVELFYSTPNQYLDAVHAADIEWPTKYDDLFPYSDGDDAYWTGYFTSRPNLKGYVREVSKDLHCQSVILGMDSIMNGADTFSKYEEVFNQMGVLQHHDAVAGTEKQAVAFDYIKTLTRAHFDSRGQFIQSLENIADTGLENMAMCKAHNSTFDECPTKSLDEDDVNELVLLLYNGSNQRKTIASVPVPHSKLQVLDIAENAIDFDIICKADTDRDCTLYFAVELDEFSLEAYYIKKTSESNHIKAIQNSGALKVGDMSLRITDIEDNVRLEISKNGSYEDAVLMNYMYYKSFQEKEGQRSGAYIFRPEQPDSKAEKYDGFTTFDSFEGNVVAQMRLYGKEVDTTITGNIYTDFVEIQSYIKGIPLSEQGQEVILHLNFDKIKNGGVFYTDSMGLEMQERKLDYRPTWNLNVTQNVSENYYPVNHGVTIKDDKMTLEVLNDRAQGASSLEEGSIEFMIQRRTYRDDGRGVGEALNETIADRLDGKGLDVLTKHYLRFYNNTVQHDVSQNSRWMQREIDSPLVMVFGQIPSGQKLKSAKFGSLMSINLPDQVKAVYLPQNDGTIFARFENILDLISSDESASLNVTNVANKLGLTMNTKVKSVTEVSNSGLYTMPEMESIKMKWKGVDFTTAKVDYSSNPDDVELTPQRIRSFVFEFESTDEIFVSS
jgi:hypothetical protein